MGQFGIRSQHINSQLLTAQPLARELRSPWWQVHLATRSSSLSNKILFFGSPSGICAVLYNWHFLILHNLLLHRFKTLLLPSSSATSSSMVPGSGGL